MGWCRQTQESGGGDQGQMEAESHGPNSKRHMPRAQVKWADRWYPREMVILS